MLLSKLSRIGKKEQPSDWPKHAESFESAVDEVRRIAGEVSKGFSQHVLLGKRGKKNAEQQLAAVFKDSIEKTAGEDKVFSHVVRESADVLNNLASLRRDFELRVEKSVVDPLNRLMDGTCAGIAKERRTFNKAYSDSRAAREQLQRAIAQLNQVGYSSNNSNNNNGSNINLAGSTFNLNGSLGSLDAVMGSSGGQIPSSDVMNAALVRYNQAQSLLDDKERELLGCKEKLLRDLYSFVAQEAKEADLLVEFLRAQEAYLEESLRLVRKAIPNLSAVIERHKPPTVFHRHLPDHLAETNRAISYALETCISRLDNEATMQEEGLFRKSGSQKKTELLVKALNLMQADEALVDSCDSMSVTVALKQYLNSLPEPLITFRLAEQWAYASKTPGSATLEVIQPIIEAMPHQFRLNLAYLCLFLHKLSTYSAVNKMTTENLSIVMAPNLYKLPNATQPAASDTTVSSDLAQSLDFLHHSGPGIRLVDLLINHAETLFAEEKMFLSNLQKDGTNRSPPQTHSRTPSNTSLLDAKPAKPTLQARAAAINAEDSVHSAREVTTIPAVSDAPAGGLLHVDNDNAYPNAPSPNSPRRRPGRLPSRKKTVAPKPPIPPTMPTPVVVPVGPASPDQQPSALCEHHPQETVITATVTSAPTQDDATTHPVSDPIQLPSVCTGMHSMRRFDLPKQQVTLASEEPACSKAPPKRPPRPIAATTPK